MEFIIYFVPFFVSIILLIYFKKEVVWWEYLVLIIPSLLLTLGTKEIMVLSRIKDTEYYGGYITQIRHYDEWDEWIEQKCTRMVEVGTDSEGNTIYEEEEYDCSYRQYHAEYWVYYTNLDSREHSLSEKTFEYIKNRFNTKMVFVDMHRNYYRIDGDAQDYFWNKSRNTIYTITEPHEYTNKVKASQSIFHFENISKKTAKELELYEYPKIVQYEQVTILKRDSILVTNSDYETIKYINGFYGKDKQFRVFILLFNAKEGIEKAYKQQSFWQGGNKNELVICFGVTSDNTVSWCYAFSWEDDQKMAIKTMSQYRNNEKLDIEKYGEWLILNLKDWKRKEFSDFKYIRITLTKEQFIGLFIFILLVNIGLSFGIIVNDYYN